MRTLVFSALILVATESAHSFDRKKTRDALIKGSAVEQQVAMQDLAAAGQEAVSVLAEVIAVVPDKMAKTRAATVLEANLRRRKNRTEDNLRALEPLLDSDDPAVVEAVARGVMQYKKHVRARGALKKAVGKAPSDKARVYLLGAFMVSNDGDKSEAEYVRGFLSDKSETVKVWSAGYLGSLGGKEGLDICKEVLNREPLDDATRGLQMRAAIAAGRIQDKALLPMLQKIGADEKYGIAQWEALVAIKEIELGNLTSHSEKAEYLKKALADRNYVRWAVSRLLAARDDSALQILDWAGKEKGLVGSSEAKNALLMIASEKNN